VADPFALLSLQTQVGEIVEQAHDLCDGLSQEAFNWRPPFRWSVGQCLIHLNLTTEEMLKGLQNALPLLHHPAAPPHYPAWERWLVSLEEPPPKVRLPTVSQLKPQPETPQQKGQVLEEFMALRNRLLVLGQQSEGLDWGRNKIPFPLLPALRVSWGSALAFALAHDRRHLYQAGLVLAHPDFPTQGEIAAE
jgi:hypothetical protein